MQETGERRRVLPLLHRAAARLPEESSNQAEEPHSPGEALVPTGMSGPIWAELRRGRERVRRERREGWRGGRQGAGRGVGRSQDEAVGRGRGNRGEGRAEGREGKSQIHPSSYCGQTKVIFGFFTDTHIQLVSKCCWSILKYIYDSSMVITSVTPWSRSSWEAQRICP